MPLSEYEQMTLQAAADANFELLSILLSRGELSDPDHIGREIYEMYQRENLYELLIDMRVMGFLKDALEEQTRTLERLRHHDDIDWRIAEITIGNMFEDALINELGAFDKDFFQAGRSIPDHETKRMVPAEHSNSSRAQLINEFERGCRAAINSCMVGFSTNLQIAEKIEEAKAIYDELFRERRDYVSFLDSAIPFFEEGAADVGASGTMLEPIRTTPNPSERIRTASIFRSKIQTNPESSKSKFKLILNRYSKVRDRCAEKENDLKEEIVRRRSLFYTLLANNPERLPDSHRSLNPEEVSEHNQLIEEFIAANVSPEIRDELGNTLYHLVLSSGNEDAAQILKCINLLLELRVTTDMANERGELPWMIAREKQNKEAFDLLKVGNPPFEIQPEQPNAEDRAIEVHNRSREIIGIEAQKTILNRCLFQAVRVSDYDFILSWVDERPRLLEYRRQLSRQVETLFVAQFIYNKQLKFFKKLLEKISECESDPFFDLSDITQQGLEDMVLEVYEAVYQKLQNAIRRGHRNFSTCLQHINVRTSGEYVREIGVKAQNRLRNIKEKILESIHERGAISKKITRLKEYLQAKISARNSNLSRLRETEAKYLGEIEITNRSILLAENKITAKRTTLITQNKRPQLTRLLALNEEVNAQAAIAIILNPDVREESTNKTLLEVAIDQKDHEMAKVLLYCGANPREKTSKENTLVQHIFSHEDGQDESIGHALRFFADANQSLEKIGDFPMQMQDMHEMFAEVRQVLIDYNIEVIKRLQQGMPSHMQRNFKNRQLALWRLFECFDAAQKNVSPWELAMGIQNEISNGPKGPRGIRGSVLFSSLSGTELMSPRRHREVTFSGYITQVNRAVEEQKHRRRLLEVRDEDPMLMEDDLVIMRRAQLSANYAARANREKEEKAAQDRLIAEQTKQIEEMKRERAEKDRRQEARMEEMAKQMQILMASLRGTGSPVLLDQPSTAAKVTEELMAAMTFPPAEQLQGDVLTAREQNEPPAALGDDEEILRPSMSNLEPG